jgi:aminoglycoside 6'-N-acetyltransferase I
MLFDIKVLAVGDEAVLGNVAPDVFDHAVDQELVIDCLRDPRHHLVVALRHNQVIGFASGLRYVHPDKRAELWVNEVGVTPSERRRGVGTTLLRELLRQAESLGCREAWVVTDGDNTEAMRLYGSLGGIANPKPSVMFTFALSPRATRER